MSKYIDTELAGTAFIKEIKCYYTDSVLEAFSKLSLDIFNKKSNLQKHETPATITLPMLHNNKKYSVDLHAWDISSIAFYSIKCSNDYKGGTLPNERIPYLVNYYRTFDNLRYELASKDRDDSFVFLFLSGMGMEQFEMQSTFWCLESFNREYHIFKASNRINRGKLKTVDDITNELFGVDLDVFAIHFLVLFASSFYNTKPLEITAACPYNETSILNRSIFNSIINYYTVNYNDVRNSIIGSQIFYSKPFVRTSRYNEIITANIYTFISCFAHSLYWLIRDYYRDDSSQLFTNTFGDIFEEYFEEVLSETLPFRFWEKIATQKNQQQADYYIEFDDSIVIVELKSALFNIRVRQQIPDIESLETYYIRNISDAVKQLKSTEAKYEASGKAIIKIILLYDHVDNTSFIMSSLDEYFAGDDLIYIMNIQEMESLLLLHNENQESFNLILEELKTPHRKHDQISVSMLFNKYSIEIPLFFKGNKDYIAGLEDELSRLLSNN